MVEEVNDKRRDEQQQRESGLNGQRLKPVISKEIYLYESPVGLFGILAKLLTLKADFEQKLRRAELSGLADLGAVGEKCVHFVANPKDDCVDRKEGNRDDDHTEHCDRLPEMIQGDSLTIQRHFRR